LSRQSTSDPEVDSRRLRELALIEQEFRQQAPTPILEWVRRPWPTERMVEAIFNMTWRVLHRPTATFVTSDNPVFFFQQYGLATVESEIHFPLSARTALHGSWQGDPRTTTFVDAPDHLAAELNRRMCSAAESFVFSSRPERWTLIQRPARVGYLSLLRW